MVKKLTPDKVLFMTLPVMLHSSLRVGVSPPYPLIITSLEALGTGMVIVIGLWNFLLLGSNVTIGLNVALLPKIFFTSSLCIGWAYPKTWTKDNAYLMIAT